MFLERNERIVEEKKGIKLVDFVLGKREGFLEGKVIIQEVDEGAAVGMGEEDLFEVFFEELDDANPVSEDDLVVGMEESAGKDGVASETLDQHFLLFVNFETSFLVFFEQVLVLFKSQLVFEEAVVELSKKLFAFDTLGLFEYLEHLHYRKPQVLYQRSLRRQTVQVFQHFLELVLLEFALYLESLLYCIAQVMTQQRAINPQVFLMNWLRHPYSINEAQLQKQAVVLVPFSAQSFAEVRSFHGVAFVLMSLQGVIQVLNILVGPVDRSLASESQGFEDILRDAFIGRKGLSVDTSFQTF